MFYKSNLKKVIFFFYLFLIFMAVPSRILSANSYFSAKKYLVDDDKKFIDYIGNKTVKDKYNSYFTLNSGYSLSVDLFDSKYVYTGGKTQIKKNNSKVDEYTNIVRGDASGDGKISSTDYIVIKKHIMDSSLISDEAYQLAADINRDNKITSVDYIKIKNIVMGAKVIDFSLETDDDSYYDQIISSVNPKISEYGIYLWESSKSMPSKATYKVSGAPSFDNDVKFNINSIDVSLEPETNYKYVFYIMVDGEKQYTNEASFSTQPVSVSVSFKKAYAAVEVGSTFNLPVEISPASLSNKVTYSSSDQSIVTVDSDGKIRGVKIGEATVTARASDKTSTIKVRVVGAASSSSPAVLYDFSEYNTVSSWKSMRDHDINYLILRLGITSTFDGTDTRLDDKFDDFVTQARNNDIELGVYYFSKADSYSTVRAEANFVLNTLNSYPKGTFSLPVYIDFEHESMQFNQTGVNYINEFCNIIEAGGYYCGAYTFYYLYTDYNMASSVKSYWVPDWTCGGKYKATVSNLGIWQFAAPDSTSCSSPTIYGVDFADVNYMYVNYSTLIINSGLNNFKK